jgi:hypothetical protein
MPQLRIADDALWDRVQRRKKELSQAPVRHRRRPKRVEARVLAGVKNLLLAPDLIQAAMRSFEAELAQSRLSAIGRRASIEKAMTATEDRINRKRGAATLWIGG